MADLEPDGCLTSDAGSRVNELCLTPMMLVDKSIAVFGPSNTGKTVIVKYLMKLLHGHVEQILIVSPSEPSNQSYKGFVPPACIHVAPYLPDLTAPAKKKGNDGSKGCLRFLEQIWERQTIMADVYHRANDPAVLATLFRRLPRGPRAEGFQIIEQLNARRQRVVDRVREQYRDDPGRRDTKAKEVNEKFREMLRLLYKKYLLPERDALWLQEGLSEEERYSLAYLQFNPRLLIVFDDCAAQMKQTFANEIWRKLFYENRHRFITFALCCQDDTDLPTNLRKNAFISFFTEPIVAAANFTRGSNNFSKPVREFVADVAPLVFKGNRKLAYIREDPLRNHFYHCTPPYPRPFRFGSEALWELCDSIQSSGRTLDSSNAFYQRFSLQ